MEQPFLNEKSMDYEHIKFTEEAIPLTTIWTPDENED